MAVDPYVQKRHWYRSTFYNATILGICNFLAPGIWGAMNSLGAGGEEKPYLVNAANALTFCLMVVSCFFGSALVNIFGIKIVLAFGTAGYAPFAAGLYTNNRYGTEWLVLFGAACCGICAGVFWMSEAAIALSYPEPYNQGKFLGYWLSYRVAGQILGGAVNLGLNVHKSGAGKVSYTVYIIFIVLQALGPFAALLLTPPGKVQRADGVPVKLYVNTGPKYELKATAKLFLTKRFLLIVPLIVQAVFPESFNGTFLTLHFSVRARALGSFLSAIVAITVGNILGWFLDRNSIALKTRARSAFVVVLGLQGCWWAWSTYIQSRYQPSGVILDWADAGFGKGFALYLFLVAGFQLNYLYLYFVVGHLVSEPEDIVRIASLLRGTESASQAVSYGVQSVESFGTVGGSALNFGLWGVSLLPAWLVIREIGVTLEGRVEREARLAADRATTKDIVGVDEERVIESASQSSEKVAAI
ncbi:hypothetical protein PHLGIDRAFT_121349 [Phlebiopsis gigantea 11061_1 CR5-6]|uniref:DUF895 domain membrane protein n=1 Tax=Phlebiopsis gigantea (strain 11061_1 CR5-6) TaxID=745531 RepID=A0A0C3S282_PHLG1|nr:hypothetical protein PHLGIDRAFT_121349 [Phlebiopsis gigantea 11061_1 CR5-6]